MIAMLLVFFSCIETSPTRTVEPSPPVTLSKTAPDPEPNHPAPWHDPIPLAGGIGYHYYLIIQHGDDYFITDSKTNKKILVSVPDLMENEKDEPIVYPTSRKRGHALARSETSDGTPVIIDFTVQWEMQKTLDPPEGAFVIKERSIYQFGAEQPRFSFQKKGSFWTKEPKE